MKFAWQQTLTFVPLLQVVHLNHFMDRLAGITKGCGFVYYENRAEAEAAIKALDGKVTVPVMSCLHSSTLTYEAW